MKNSLLSIFAVLFVTGCSTMPTPVKEAKQVPQSRLFSYQEKRTDTTSTIVITRDTGIAGSGCNWAISINDNLAALIDSGETSRFFLAPGEVVFRLGLNPQGKGLCSAAKDKNMERTRETMLHENETKFFRLFLVMDNGIDIQRSSGD